MGIKGRQGGGPRGTVRVPANTLSLRPYTPIGGAGPRAAVGLGLRGRPEETLSRCRCLRGGHGARWNRALEYTLVRTVPRDGRAQREDGSGCAGGALIGSRCRPCFMAVAAPKMNSSEAQPVAFLFGVAHVGVGHVSAWASSWPRSLRGRYYPEHRALL